MAEGLARSRKKKVQGGHRLPTIRIMGQASEALNPRLESGIVDVKVDAV